MIRTLITLFFILVIPLCATAADSIRPGYWQLVSTMEIPDMPVQITPTSARYCFSADEAGDPRMMVRRLKDCAITDFSSAGNRITWKMACSGSTPGTLNGDALLKGDAFTAFMKLRSRGNAMNMRIKARRLGECPQQPPPALP